MNFWEYFEVGWFLDQMAISYFLLAVLIMACWLLMQRLSPSKPNQPPGPSGLPFLGYLLFLGKEPFRTMDNLKKKYGNVISLYLGQTKVIILADNSAVEDALGQTATTYRPPGLFGFLPNGFGIAGFNGKEWVEQRRFVLKTMRNLGLGKSTWVSHVKDEIDDFLKEIANQNGKPVDVGKLLAPSITNNIVSLLFGRRLPSGPVVDSLTSALGTIMEFFSQSSVFNYYPRLYDLLAKLNIGGYHKIMKEMVFFNMFMKKEAENNKKSLNDSEKIDFVSQYLEVLENNQDNVNSTFNESNMIGNTQAVFTGASETTISSLTWLFLEMANFADIQEKVHTELNTVLGKGEVPQWEDRTKFPYTYAVIMESQRWRTLVPLNLARMTSEDTKICGYDIEKGTTILTNIWGLHHDPRYWPEPEKFIPDRFLQNEGKEVKTKAESYMPFSYGKRRCPGETVALMEIFLYFIAVMQRFEVRTPNGKNPQMEGIMGITFRPASQDLCFIPLL